MRLSYNMMNNMHKWGIAVFFVTFIPLAVVVPLITSFQFRSAASFGENLVASAEGENLDSAINGNELLAIEVRVTSIDIANNVAKVNIEPFPLYSLSEQKITFEYLQDNAGSTEFFTQLKTPSINLNLSLAGNVSQFKKGIPMAQLTLSLPFFAGDSTLYPFDSYGLELGILAFKEGNSDPIPILVVTDSVLPLLNIQSTIPSKPNLKEVNINFTIDRSKTAKGFSIFVILTQWVLACSLYALSTGVWIRGRKVEAGIISACLAFLFALPNLRNAQPGIPSVTGCVSDLLSFYWVMILAAISTILAIINYCVNYRAEVKPRRLIDDQTKVALMNPMEKQEV